jgi:hypothetical protein
MTTAADRLRAQQQRAAERRAAASPVVKPVDRPVQRTKPVRMTLDLAPDLHARFARWCTETAPKLGERANLPGVEVVRLLLGRLLADEDLQRSVIEDLRRDAW